MTQGLAAGPFGAPIRYDGPSYGVQGGWERPIAMYRTMFSFVLQIQSPTEQLKWRYAQDEAAMHALGGTFWYCQDSPHGSVFVPFSCAQTALPPSYTTGNQSIFNPASAWWAFNFVNQWSMMRWNVINADVMSYVHAYEAKGVALQASFLNRVATTTNDTTTIIMKIEHAYNQFASQVVQSWWELAWYLVGKYSCGYITTGEGPGQMRTPGYNANWLALSEFAGWPNHSGHHHHHGHQDADRHAKPPLPLLSSASSNDVMNVNGTSRSNVGEILGYMVLGALIALGTHAWAQKHQRRAYYHAL
jgi:hypothetical protein